MNHNVSIPLVMLIWVLLAFLDIMNNGAVNICVQFFWYTCTNFCLSSQGVELQGHKGCMCSAAKGFLS